jgi:phage gp45-like
MKEQIRELGAKLRNMFVTGEFQKRYGDGRIQVRTHNARVIEKKEAFPYGFYAKAKGGRAFVFCQGGNLDGFEILPVVDYEGGPALEEGDAALYTASGVSVICREDGGMELLGKAGKILVQKTGAVEINGTAGNMKIAESGTIEAAGSGIALQQGGFPAARKTDTVVSTAADDPAFWEWITTVSSVLAALSGGSLTPPSQIMSKITAGSATVMIG